VVTLSPSNFDPSCGGETCNALLLQWCGAIVQLPHFVGVCMTQMSSAIFHEALGIHGIHQMRILFRCRSLESWFFLQFGF
jgi:hypothetical protein